MKPAPNFEQLLRVRHQSDKPVITTCGSGVTACTLALGLAVIGNEHAAVYDARGQNDGRKCAVIPRLELRRK